MILRQFYLNCLAHASYLVGDESTGWGSEGRSRYEERASHANGVRRRSGAREPAFAPEALRRGLAVALAAAEACGGVRGAQPLG